MNAQDDGRMVSTAVNGKKTRSGDALPDGGRYEFADQHHAEDGDKHQ